MRTPHHDREEIRRLLQIRLDEKLTFQQLADRTGIPAHVFVYRAGQDRAESPTQADSALRFIELESPDVPGPVGGKSGVTLHLASGHHISLESDFDSATLEKLLSALPC